MSKRPTQKSGPAKPPGKPFTGSIGGGDTGGRKGSGGSKGGKGGRGK